MRMGTQCQEKIVKYTVLKRYCLVSKKQKLIRKESKIGLTRNFIQTMGKYHLPQVSSPLLTLRLQPQLVRTFLLLPNSIQLQPIAHLLVSKTPKGEIRNNLFNIFSTKQINILKPGILIEDFLKAKLFERERLRTN